jgi:hypothetical protein
VTVALIGALIDALAAALVDAPVCRLSGSVRGVTRGGRNDPDRDRPGAPPPPGARGRARPMAAAR